MGQIRLWKWQHTYEVFGTREVMRHRLFKTEAYAGIKDAADKDGSFEIGSVIPPTRAEVATSSRETAG
jgi:hypothetical protein